jgi:hypothetical protein
MKDGKSIVQQFETQFQPHESGALVLLTDKMTGAQYCNATFKRASSYRFRPSTRPST